MKRLILVCGANGIGKSTACRELTMRLDHTAYVDSDYCRFVNPFSFSEEEIAAVVSNISTMMLNYFRLSTVENVLFSYGFHGPRKNIFDRVLQTLTEEGISYRLCPILLECGAEENIRRMRGEGRDEVRIKNAIEKTRNIYDSLSYPRIDVTDLSIPATADRMLEILSSQYSES